MVIKDLLIEGIKILEKNPNINTQLESRLILSMLMEVDKSYLYGYLEKDVKTEIADKFIELVKKRSDGYPLQYILGVQEFMGLNFIVKEGALIPRGDTEILVHYLIEYVKKKFADNKFTLLDIGVGSGAISLSMAHHCPSAIVFGVDIQQEAIDIALENKNNLDLNNVNYYLGDLFSPFKDHNYKFDIIVSNPPYIPEYDRETLQREVIGFEPETALFGGEDGLDYYRKITIESINYLKEGALLAYEVGYNQGEYVKNIMDEVGFVDLKIMKDLEERDRVVVGTFKRRD